LFTFINSIDDLEFLNQELLKKDYLGVDTEFRRTRKDNMTLALLQVNDGEEIYLIDTIHIQNPDEKCSFLFSENVVKIIHSCKEDLEAVFSWTNKSMTNIFDTQLANSLLGKDYSIGYQGLVEQELEISLEKKETRSNWIRRPLSSSQLKYAALDVEYLPHIYLKQRHELIKSNKLDWYNEDINKLIETSFNTNFILKVPLRSVPKSEENNLLSEFNNIIKEISDTEQINPTFFFSKKSQKDFLRLALTEGLDSALHSLTNWRQRLIKEKLSGLLS